MNGHHSNALPAGQLHNTQAVNMHCYFPRGTLTVDAKLVDGLDKLLMHFH
jgi:hypothetical protein